LALVALALYVRLRVLGLDWRWCESRAVVLGWGGIDAIQLLVVFVLAYRVTNRVLPAVAAGLVLAVTPPSTCGRRRLGRVAIASLLQTVAMLLVLRAVAPSAGSVEAALSDASFVPALLAAILVCALAYVDVSTAIPFCVSAAVLTVLEGDFRTPGLVLLGIALAVVIAAAVSPHARARVVHVFAQSPEAGPENQHWLAAAGRLLGENPFVVLPVALPLTQTPWAVWMYWWTLAAVGLAVLTAFAPPMRILGTGVGYMRISIFPAAYVLALRVDEVQGDGVPNALLLLLGAVAGLAALAYVYRLGWLPSTLPAPVDRILTLAWSHCRSVVALLVGGALIVLALSQVAHAIGAVIQPDELMYGEAIIYDHAARIVRGEPLYLPLGQAPYSIAAYTPVYYWIVAGLQDVFGPGFGPGRGASLLAGLVAAIFVADLARRRARSVWAGVFAAALFLALGFPTQGLGLEYPWFAYYKEDVLGVTFALGAIAVLDRGASSRTVVLAAVLAALGVLTKQTLVAAGAAGFVWLALRQPRLALLFGATAAVVVLGVSGIMALEDPAYLTNVLAVAGRSDPLNDFVLQQNLRTLLQYQAAPLAIMAVYLLARLRDWRKALDDIMVPYALASLVPLVGLAKIGSNYNYWIDLAAIAAVATTHAIWGGVNWRGLGLGPTSLRRVEAFAPILLLVVLGAHLLVYVRDVQPSLNLLAILPTEQQRSVREDADFQWVVDRVRTEPKMVLSESLDVVVLAGRPMIAEPIIFSQMVADDQWNDEPLARQICDGKVGLLILKGPLDGTSEIDRYMRSALWPPHVLEALRETMQLETSRAQLLIYSPSPRASAVASPPSTPAVCLSE
jgi:hypothetical protein